MDDKQAGLILRGALSEFAAKIQTSESNVAQEISTLTEDLSVARTRENAKKISFPFKSIYISDATDINTFVYVIPDNNNNGTADLKMSLRDVLTFEFGIRAVYLYWPAQPSKSIVIKTFVTGKISSGSLVLNQNSVPASVALGFASGDLDGFTRQVRFDYFVDTGTQYVYDINNPQLNNGSYTNSLGLTSAAFKIPAGFYGEIIGCEMDVLVAPDTTVPLEIYAIDNGSTYAENTISTAFKLGYVYDPTIDVMPTVADSPYDVKPVNDCVVTEKGYDRGGLILIAGEIPVVVIRSLGPTVGSITGFFLIRLKPIVGA